MGRDHEASIVGGREKQTRGTGPSTWSGWADIVLPVCLMLAIAVPVLVVEENWHGHPMIDDPNQLWLVPAFIVGCAFLCGGALSGYRRPEARVRYAVGTAAIVLSALMLADLFRRVFVVHQGQPQRAVFGLWGLGVVAGLAFSMLGALLGRRLAVHRRVTGPSARDRGEDAHPACDLPSDGACLVSPSSPKDHEVS